MNSGLVLVGTIGGGGLPRFGVVGDPVNVAARVQDATRDLGEPLLLTEATQVLLEDDHPELVAARLARAARARRRRSRVYGLAVTLSGRSTRRTRPDVGTD